MGERAASDKRLSRYALAVEYTNSMRLPPGYRLIRVISPGPLTTVALARDAEGATRVVKRAAIGRAAGAIAHEATVLTALAQARVAGVPRLVGEWSDAFAMEWLELPTLGERGDVMRANAGFRERVVRAAFTRLDAIHAAGVVHGDVSPGNVFVAEDAAFAAMADFGLAQMEGEACRDGAFRGTLLYVAPEVARGEPFGARADDFALAASLLQMASGEPLRRLAGPGASPASLLLAAGSHPLDALHPWRRRAPELFPAAMAEVLLQCLAYDARDRPSVSRAW